MLKKWQLKDVILLAFLSIFFLVCVFVGSGYLFDILTLILALLVYRPLPMKSSLVSGVWLRPLRLSLFQESEVRRLEGCSLRLLKFFMVANSA